MGAGHCVEFPSPHEVPESCSRANEQNFPVLSCLGVSWVLEFSLPDWFSSCPPATESLCLLSGIPGWFFSLLLLEKPN